MPEWHGGFCVRDGCLCRSISCLMALAERLCRYSGCSCSDSSCLNADPASKALSNGILSFWAEDILDATSAIATQLDPDSSGHIMDESIPAIRGNATILLWIGNMKALVSPRSGWIFFPLGARPMSGDATFPADSSSPRAMPKFQMLGSVAIARSRASLW